MADSANPQGGPPGPPFFVSPNAQLRRQFWRGYCHTERLPAMAQIETAISHYGYILNFQRFSDLSLGLLIEIGAARLAALYTELQAVMDMEGLEPISADTAGDCMVFLNVTFAHGSGQLRIEVPKVPG